MKNYLKDYIKKTDEVIASKKYNKEELRRTHLEKIQMFQHERLIHLIVTVFYAVFMILFLFLSTIEALYIVAALIVLICLIFYVKHYFFLENSVQYLYKQYDEIIK